MRIRIEGEFEAEPYECSGFYRIEAQPILHGPGNVDVYVSANICAVIEVPIKKGSMVWVRLTGGNLWRELPRFYVGMRQGVHFVANNRTSARKGTGYEVAAVRLVTPADLEVE